MASCVSFAHRRLTGCAPGVELPEVLLGARLRVLVGGAVHRVERDVGRGLGQVRAVVGVRNARAVARADLAADCAALFAHVDPQSTAIKASG